LASCQLEYFRPQMLLNRCILYIKQLFKIVSRTYNFHHPAKHFTDLI